jgi:ABC-2 type transport system permease protein
VSRAPNFVWSVRRELWENRALLVTPVVIAALVLAAFVYALITHAEYLRAIAAFESLLPRKGKAAIFPFGMAAAAILFFSWIAAVFYALDALAGERRDRSILFWKSMPVSDATTVLSKAAVALVVVPIYACLVVLLTQAIMLAILAVALAAKGVDATAFWARMPFFQMPVGMLYGMAAHALWFAPAFGWLLLVSAWARRAAFLWAFMPFFGAYAFEKVAFGTNAVGAFLRSRLHAAEAFKVDAMRDPITQLSQLDPARFLASPGLWLGLVLAALLVVSAIRLRRHRGPL